MRAIKIDPKERTVTEIDIEPKIYAFYSEMRCDAICLAFVHGRDDCFVDDEGLLNDPQFFFLSEWYPQPLAGVGIIIGSNPNSGNWMNCKLSLEEVKSSTKFLTLAEVQQIIRQGKADYNTYITTSSGTERISTRDLGAFDEPHKGDDVPFFSKHDKCWRCNGGGCEFCE